MQWIPFAIFTLDLILSISLLRSLRLVYDPFLLLILIYFLFIYLKTRIKITRGYTFGIITALPFFFLKMTITRKLFSSTDRTFPYLPDEGIASTKSIKSLWTNYRVFLIGLNLKKKRSSKKFRVARMLHFGNTMPHLGQRKISSEKPLIQPSCTLGLFHCWKLKKSLELI